MQKLRILSVYLLLTIPCSADTFINHRTGETFDGYVIKRTQGNKTLVYVEREGKQYLDLNDYQRSYNYLGRKNKVFIFSVKNSIELICETEAFEKALESAANQGPLFILIEIDTPGGRVDLAQRICGAIAQIDNCRTVAFINGSKSIRTRRNREEHKTHFGGAFSAGAMVALACDKIFMLDGTAIGAAASYVETSSGPKDLKTIFGETIGEKFSSALQAYFATIAERNNRPGLLARAMVEKDIEVIEVIESGKNIFIDPANKQANQSFVRTCSDKGSLLTLTAIEAARCGMADKVVTSPEEFFEELGATEATKVFDTVALKARREFERIQSKFQRILASIRSYEEKAVAIAEGLADLDKTILKDSKVYYDSYGRVMKQYNPEAISRRTYLIGEWQKIKKILKEHYREALFLAKNHPDLQDYISTLEKGLESCNGI